MNELKHMVAVGDSVADRECKPFCIFSFFSGAGFLDLGFEHAGFEIVSVNELWKPFIRVYKHARNKLGIEDPRYGYKECDVNDFLGPRLSELQEQIADSRKRGQIVGFIAGPPCPDFSIAGKQAGRDGERGQLSDSYVSLIEAAQPDFFLFENVKGLWSTKRHRAYYEELKERLSDSYYLTDRLCNALEFGAPQDRDRVILIGVDKKRFEPLDDFDWSYRMSYELERVKEIPWPNTEPFLPDSNRPCPDGIIHELTVQCWFEKNDVTRHANAGRHFIPRQGLSRMQTVDEGDDSRKSYKRLHRWRYSPTVAYGNNEVHLHPYKARRLDVAEALALQSLPREFELPNDMTLSDSFKTVGNGVPYLLANGIAITIRDWMMTHGNFNCS